MKLALFFLISVALHAAAFFYSVPFMEQRHAEFIPVTIISLDEFPGGSGREGAAKRSKISKPAGPAPGKKNSTARFHASAKSHLGKLAEKTVSAGEEMLRRAAPPETAPAREAVPQRAPAELPSAFDHSGPTGGEASFSSLADTASAGPAVGGSGGEGGQGLGGAGQGAGAGGGRFSNRNAHLIQARYRETSKPLYPERAREEGRQGRVLLRVLVDREGRVKSVEVSGSSGSETLDRAAAEAVKLWRFSPARYGDKPVESWVRIPVDFRLTDTADQ